MSGLAMLLGRLDIAKPFRRAAICGALAAGAVAVVWVWLVHRDAKVIERHEAEVKAAAAPALEKAAEERVTDAFENQRLRDQRDAAIAKAEAMEQAKAPEARSTLAPTAVALNCVRMRQAYSAAELAKMAAYRERC